jgi:hypothetical protein
MIDLDDLLEDVFGDAVIDGLGRSRRAQLLLRMFFGLIGAGLGLAGCVWMLTGGGGDGSTHLRLAMAAVFLFMACFFGANVMLARPWRWPAIGFVASVVALFVSRAVLGP